MLLQETHTMAASTLYRDHGHLLHWGLKSILGCRSGSLVRSRGWRTCPDATGVSSSCYWLLGEAPSRISIVQRQRKCKDEIQSRERTEDPEANGDNKELWSPGEASPLILRSVDWFDRDDPWSGILISLPMVKTGSELEIHHQVQKSLGPAVQQSSNS